RLLDLGIPLRRRALLLARGRGDGLPPGRDRARDPGPSAPSGPARGPRGALVPGIPGRPRVHARGGGGTGGAPAGAAPWPSPSGVAPRAGAAPCPRRFLGRGL